MTRHLNERLNPEATNPNERPDHEPEASHPNEHLDHEPHATHPNEHLDHEPHATHPGEHLDAEPEMSGADVPGSPAPHREHPVDEPAQPRDAYAESRENWSLIEPAQADRLQREWAGVQSQFVDDPQRALGEANRLAGEAVDTLQAALATRKRTLDQKWETDVDRGADTERMRLALRGYRDLVDHILKT